jgi:hypothetical protein
VARTPPRKNSKNAKTKRMRNKENAKTKRMPKQKSVYCILVTLSAGNLRRVFCDDKSHNLMFDSAVATNPRSLLV